MQWFNGNDKEEMGRRDNSLGYIPRIPRILNDLCRQAYDWKESFSFSRQMRWAPADRLGCLVLAFGRGETRFVVETKKGWQSNIHFPSFCFCSCSTSWEGQVKNKVFCASFTSKPLNAFLPNYPTPKGWRESRRQRPKRMNLFASVTLPE